MLDPLVKEILNARVYDVAVETPLDAAPRLSERLGERVWLKREDMQPVFSFKLRGAYNKMAHLSPDELARGVVCSSAGNHAQGVALSARKLGCEATIVMPVTTPSIKSDAVRRLGGKVVLHGDSYDDAQAHALAISEETEAVFVHPYDDPLVIAGQGTVAMELLRQHSEPIDVIFVAVGGGGLIGGVAAYVKALRPEIRIVGVEPVDCASMTRALEAGRPVALESVGKFADGVAVKQVGEQTYALCADLIDEMITVDTDAICAAIKDVFEETRSILEPAGALGVAGLKAWAARNPGSNRSLVAVACGANMNFDRLRQVSERTELGEGREALFAATIPEERGSFKAFCQALGDKSITGFSYRTNAAGDAAHILVAAQVSGADDTDALYAHLREQGIGVEDLRDNELAKLHLPHMVGGHAVGLQDERIYRFEFPERAGALMDFFEHMGEHQWNISLFHYRAFGSEVGRVLMGIQVPEDEQDEFDAFLARVGYRFTSEADNPVIGMFLG